MPRMHTSTLIATLALDKVNHTPRPLYPRKTDPVLISEEVGWTPGAVWTGAENLTPT
jgi:hypothetical protein